MAQPCSCRVVASPAGMAHSYAHETSGLRKQGQNNQLPGKARRCMLATRGRGLSVCLQHDRGAIPLQGHNYDSGWHYTPVGGASCVARRCP